MKTRVRRIPKDMEVQTSLCGTCPYRKDSKLAFLVPDLTQSALTDCSRICHSTGGNTVVHPRSKTKGKEKLCRGARDVQLQVFHSLGFIEAPTDEAWDKKCKELGIL